MKYAAIVLSVAVLGVAGCQTSTVDSHEAPSPSALRAVSAPANPRSGSFWGTWEAKNDPALLGKKVAMDLLTRDMTATNYRQRGGMSYPEVCVAYGSLRFAGEVKDKELLEKLVKRYEVFFVPESQYLIPRANNVDNSAFGILPMEIYRQTGMTDKKWLDLGKGHADTEWAMPRADGLTPYTRMWVDDMFMITALQAEAFRVTKDQVYLDRAAKEMVVYLDQLQLPNGLFYHAADSPYIWGRGDGWFAVGMAELLSVLPATHPNHARILDGYKKMMAGLVKNQGKDGMWRQLIDIDDPRNTAETSGTGMLIFSMANGVRRGWLDEPTYKEPVKKAWIAYTGYLNAEGKVTEVCIGTNKGSQTTGVGASPAMLNFYLTRPRTTGDFHGQAAFIWASWAMAMDPQAK